MGKQLLEGERGSYFKVDPQSLVVIGVDTEHRSIAEHRLYDPRVHTTWATLPETTVLDIMARGVQETILVELDEQDRPIVFSGRGRTLMAREANRRLVAQGLPAKVVPVRAVRGNSGNYAHHDAVSISLNEHRKDDTPMNRATKVGYLLASGHSKEAVAVMFGVTEQAIDQWNSLLDLSPSCKEAVESGKIGASAAADLARLSQAEQDARLERLLGQANGGRVKGKDVKRDLKGWATPGRKDLRKVAALIEAGEYVGKGQTPEYSEGFRAGLLIAIGDEDPARVPYLRKVLGMSGETDEE